VRERTGRYRGARVRQPREEERLQGRRLTRGTHLAVKGDQQGWWYAGWWAERPSGPAALAGRRWKKVGVIR
jgi:hypothetical protein